MKKLIFAVALLVVSAAANAVPVYLSQQNINASDGVPSTYINDGTHPNFSGAATSMTWDWDGTTLTGTGNYSAALAIGSTVYGPGLLEDTITNLTIDTSTSTASADAYACESGSFLGFVQFCGGYDYGANYFNETTLTYGPGLAFDITCGGDDVCATPNAIDGVRNLVAYDFGLELWDGTNLRLGTGIPTGTSGAESMVFSTIVPVPAAAWLFGSALGLLGWMRRRATV